MHMGREMVSWLKILIGIIVFYHLFRHLAGPLLVWKTQSVPERYQLQELEDEETDWKSDDFSGLHEQFLENGFRFAGARTISGTEMRFHLYMKGEYHATLAQHPEPGGLTVWQEFTQLFSDGALLDVNNSKHLPVYPKNEDKIALRFPKTTTVQELERLFLRIRDHHFKSRARKSNPPEQVFVEMESSMNRELEQLIEMGYYADTAKEGRRKISLKGAIIFCWKLLWPWKFILNRIGLGRAERMAKV